GHGRRGQAERRERHRDDPPDGRGREDPARREAHDHARSDERRPVAGRRALPRRRPARLLDHARARDAEAVRPREAGLAVKRLLVAALAALALAAPAAAATPGVTKTEILLGGTGPLTGAESAYEPVLSGANAYFQYVNANGGVYGRKIVYRYLDDGYDPARTVQLTQQLVEQDGVFAIFNTIGTEHSIAIRDYLNQRKVPELFVGSGATAIGSGQARYPWTMGLLPSFVGEGTIYGRRIATAAPRAKVAVLYEDSVYGRELLAGLRKGLGAH